MDTTGRRLLAVLAADAVGFSRLMAEDEAATVAMLDECRSVFRSQVEAAHGRVVDTAGDSVLAVFDTVTGAVQAAQTIQALLAKRVETVPESLRMRFRIGVNLGEVIEKEDGTVYGDGVNIAARLEKLSDPGGLCISGNVHEQIEGKLPLTFEFIGQQEVKNIPKPVRAFHLLPRDATRTVKATHKSYPNRKRVALGSGIVAAIVVAVVWWTGSRTHGPQFDFVSAMPTGPSIAVLPFDSLSGNPDDSRFADGIAEDVLTGLAKFTDLKVIGRNSSFKYRGKSVDVREVGRDLKADYVLEGSVRRTPTTIRVSAQLLKASDGAHVWAQTFDRDLTTRDVLAIQDDITGQVIGAVGGVQGAIAVTRLQALRRRAPTDIASYECVLLAYRYQQVVTAENHLAARNCLEAVVDREPDYVDALAWLGQMYLEEIWSGFNPRANGQPPLDAALKVLSRAVSLDPNHQRAHHALAIAYYHKKDLPQFRAEAARALSVNPNHIDTVVEMAMWLGFSGDWEQSAALLRKAKRLGGEIPSWSYWTEFNYHYNRSEYDQALDAARRTVELGYWATPGYMAAAYGRLGDARRAKESLAEARRLEPKFSREMFDELMDKLFLDREHYARLMEGFDRALALESTSQQ
jgi:adenylate cyclase